MFLSTQDAVDQVELSIKIRKISTDILIIYITQSNDVSTLARGLEIKVFRLITKPINETDIFKVLTDCFTEISKRQSQTLIVKNQGELMPVPYKDIMYIKSKGHYQLVSTTKSQY